MLGLVSAAAAAKKGFKVIAFDQDADLCASLREGQLPLVEPGLDELVRQCSIEFTSQPVPHWLAATIIYVAPDVPTNDAGKGDLSPILDLISLADESTPFETVLVVLSQVPPGFMASLELQRTAVFYQVETLVFGEAVQRALHPERFIIGCRTHEQALPDALRMFLDSFGCPILPMRYESAELAKISINCCLAASISVTNTLAELCEGIGADWSEIVPALKLDKRIGPHAYLTPGLGIAGGNLERDLATVVQLADRKGTEAGVVRSWLTNSAHRKNWDSTPRCIG